MGRTHQKATPPDIQLTKIEDPNIITQIREYQLITPLFGGGVKAGENDSLTPIRGTAIRGQLRYWWRATRGGKPEFGGEVAGMKEAEGRIWGTATLTKDQSPQKIADVIQIRVEIIQAGEAQEPFRLQIDENKRDRNNIPRRTPKENRAKAIHAYAAFPLQPQEKELKSPDTPKLKTVRDNISFRLIITFPKIMAREVNNEVVTEEIAPEVEAALWAWETFGGIGARTRRGFGALKCIHVIENGQEKPLDQPSAQPAQAQAWLQKKLGEHRVQNGTWPQHVPYLNQDLIDRKTFYLLQDMRNRQQPKEIWYTLIEALKDFRQMRLESKYGPTLWPEPEVIRSLLTQRPFKSRWPRPIFPRAAFGLPIIFHFQKPSNKPGTKPRVEPPDTTLQPSADEERMASPLILRPLACQGNAYLGLALILDGYDIPNPQSTIALQKPKLDKRDAEKPKPIDVQAQVNATEARDIVPLKGNTNVLEAFLKSIR